MRAEIPEGELQRAREIVSTLNDEASKFGLHSKQAQIGMIESGQTAIVMDFRIGDLAFTDRVQDPATDAENDAIRALEADVVRKVGIDAFLETRRKLEGDHGE